MNSQKHQERLGRRAQAEAESLWITYAAAQRLTSLGRTTLWRLVKSGAVKSAPIGRAVRIHRGSLEDFMERRAEGPVE